MLRDQLATFIRQNLLHDASQPLGPDDSLIDSGIVNSMGLLRLVSFIEQQTGVRIPDTMITPDNFESIAAIDAAVQQARGKATA